MIPLSTVRTQDQKKLWGLVWLLFCVIISKGEENESMLGTRVRYIRGIEVGKV